MDYRLLAIGLCLMLPNVGFSYIIISDVSCGHVVSEVANGTMARWHRY